MKKTSVFLIIIAGIFWGCIGVFGNILTSIGFDTSQRTAIRLGFCAIALVLVNIRKLKISTRDIPLFVVAGIVSVFSMCYTYYKSINISSLALASVLLYTAPIMVTVMSAIFYKEKMTPLKIVCLAITFIGIVMISGLDSKVNISLLGIVFGLLSAFTYATYSIFGKKLLTMYEPIVVTTYTSLVGAVLAVIVCNPAGLVKTVGASENILYTVLIMIGTGVITAAIPYALYTIGLKNVPASKASVLACVEPVTACIIGVLIYGDTLGPVSVIGMLMILGAVCALSYDKPKKN